MKRILRRLLRVFGHDPAPKPPAGDYLSRIKDLEDAIVLMDKVKRKLSTGSTAVFTIALNACHHLEGQLEQELKRAGIRE